MSEAQRRSAYHAALLRLFPGWTHESRSHLASISSNLDVIAEIAAKYASDPICADMAPWIQRARNGVKQLSQAFQRQSDTVRPPEPMARMDLSEELLRLETLMGQCAMDRDVVLKVSTPGPGVRIDWDLEIREALTIVAVESMCATAAKQKLEIKLEVNGDRAALRFEGPIFRPEECSWLAVVSPVFEARGGAVGSLPAAALQLTLPLATVTR